VSVPRRLHLRDPAPPEEAPPQATRATFDADFEARVVQVWALVGEAIAGATHALLAGDRELAKAIVGNDEAIDELVNDLVGEVSRALELGTGTTADRRRLVTLVRTLPELERNGDLAAHIARRAARGLGQEMSHRARGLIERMGEVATTIWRAATDAVESGSQASLDGVEELDDELDDLHVSLTGELVSGSMPLPVAVEVAMVARFYERFGDHAVNLANRQPGRSLVD
jgi:phosphate transport system protein